MVMNWTNEKIKQIALQQSAIDANCNVEAFACGENVITISKENPLARKYLKLPHALCEDRKELDVLGVGAYHDEKLIGLAACSADCDIMWQIGVDVLPEYRRKGIAAALTSRLAIEILERGKVPFYCCAWSNLKSARNAIKSGFRPAWIELTVKPASFVEEMNR